MSIKLNRRSFHRRSIFLDCVTKSFFELLYFLELKSGLEKRIKRRPAPGDDLWGCFIDEIFISLALGTGQMSRTNPRKKDNRSSPEKLSSSEMGSFRNESTIIGSKVRKTWLSENRWG